MRSTRFAAVAMLALALAGCQATPATKIVRAELTVGAAADAVRVGIETGHLRGTVAAQAKFAVNAASDALDKVQAAYKAGDDMGRDFWIARVAELLAALPPEAK